MLQGFQNKIKEFKDGFIENKIVPDSICCKLNNIILCYNMVIIYNIMRIALLISGRLTRYEECLLPMLENCSDKHTIEVFASINDGDSEYYNNAKTILSKFLKGLYVKPYELPKDFNHTHEFKFANLLMDGVYVPYNQMSMYFNDNNSFNMALEYSKNNNFEYEIIMKYRADIINNEMPFIINQNFVNNNILYSIKPICVFESHGIYKRTIISDAFAWGCPEVMQKYCDTYNYVLNKLKEFDGNYYIGFEDCVTDNCYDKNLTIEYIIHNHRLDKYRRMFDKNNLRNERYLSGTESFDFDKRNFSNIPKISATPQEGV